MNDAELVAALAEALHGSLCSCEAVDAGTGFFIRSADQDKATAALLPVVRRVAEQRAAEARVAQQLWDRSRVQDYADTVGVELTPGDDMADAVHELYQAARAAALTAAPNHGRNAT